MHEKLGTSTRGITGRRKERGAFSPSLGPLRALLFLEKRETSENEAGVKYYMVNTYLEAEPCNRPSQKSSLFYKSNERDRVLATSLRVYSYTDTEHILIQKAEQQIKWTEDKSDQN